MRSRSGKSARMAEQDFDRNAVNDADDRIQPEITKEDQPKIDGSVVSENNDELNQVDESTEDLAKKENKQASSDDPSNDEAPKSKPADEKINTDGQDEAQLPAEEFEAGIDKAEKK